MRRRTTASKRFLNNAGLLFFVVSLVMANATAWARFLFCEPVLAQHRYYLLSGRGFFIGLSAAQYVEQFRKRPYRVMY